MTCFSAQDVPDGSADDRASVTPLSVTTVVRDASPLGGGATGVARALHAGLGGLAGIETSFVSRGGADDRLANAHGAGPMRGLSTLPPDLMSSVVHIHGMWNLFEYHAFREARRRGARVVFSPHGALDRWALQHKRGKKRAAWWLYQRRVLQAADLLIVNSERERLRMRELGLRPPIATIGNGVDHEGFSLPRAEGRLPIILYLSRLSPEKGLEDLIDAWAGMATHRGHRLHIHGYGKPDYVRSLEQRIRDTGCQDIALLPPAFGAARWPLFTNASFFVLPSYTENFGIAVAEALTAGLAVITTKATPWGHLAEEGLGWIVGNDVRELREALEAATSADRASVLDMRRNAIAHARGRFDWCTIAERYRETYAWLLNRDGPAPGWIDPGVPGGT